MNRLIFLLPALCLAACSDEPQERGEDSELEAKGEILGGTISDDMLPLESVASQSPPLAGEEERLERLANEQADVDSSEDAGAANSSDEAPPAEAPQMPSPATTETADEG